MTDEPADAGDDDATVIVGDDTGDTTTPVRRANRARPDHVDEEATVVVPRGVPAPDDDDTASMSTDGVAPDVGPVVEVDVDVDDDDATVIVHEAPLVRAEVDDDKTVIVEAQVPETIAVPHPEPTVPVERGTSGLATVRIDAASSAPVRPVMVPPRKRRRGELRPAPVPSGFGGMPFVGSGAGAVSTYRVRTIEPPPSRIAAASDAHAPNRIVGTSVSVERRSRTLSIATLLTVAASTVLLAGGVVWAVKDLVGF